MKHMSLALVAACLAPLALAAPPGFNKFPDVATTAKAGESVLVPSYNWIEDAAKPGGEKTTFIYYAQTMTTPGATTSVVKFMGGDKEVPNSYIIAIPKGAKAKKGDIVLTWWQSGSGMQRAIVTDAKDPTQPSVRYLDLTYDNPAKSRDGKTTIGQMDEQLKPDTFTVLKEGDPGSVHACQDGDRKTRWRLASTAKNGQQLMLGFAGKMQVFAKGACKPTPLKPNVKVGQEVEVEFVGSFTKLKVEKVDAAIGRVFVTQFGKPKAIAFGDVLP